MKPLSLFLLVSCQAFLHLSSFSQANSIPFATDGNSRPLYLKKEYAMEGSPFYPADPCFANIQMKNGKRYENIKLRFYLPDEQLIYQDSEGVDMITTVPIERITFICCTGITGSLIFQSGFPPVDGHSDKTFYQVLDTGRTKLLKGYQVTYRDNTAYGSASPTRTYEQTETLYAFNPVLGIRKLTKNKEAVLQFLPDKKKEVENFITTHHLTCKHEEDLVKVFAWYNTIAGKS